MKYIACLMAGCLLSSCSYFRQKMEERQMKVWEERIAVYRNLDTAKQHAYLQFRRERQQLSQWQYTYPGWWPPGRKMIKAPVPVVRKPDY